MIMTVNHDKLLESTPSQMCVMDYWTKQPLHINCCIQESRSLAVINQLQSKTMVGTLASELLGSLQVYDYRRCILYISPCIGMSQADFATRDDYNRWQVDTSLTFKSKCCKNPKPRFLVQYLWKIQW